MDKKHVLLGECKWTDDPIDQKVLHDLLEQGDLFSQKEQYFYLYSKNGFTNHVLKEANQDSRIHLISIEDIYHNHYPYAE